MTHQPHDANRAHEYRPMGEVDHDIACTAGTLTTPFAAGGVVGSGMKGLVADADDCVLVESTVDEWRR